MTRFIGVDGESCSDEPGHRLVMICADDAHGTFHQCIEDPEGISTLRCFDFLLDLQSKELRPVSFAFNYDVNMILRDLTRTELRILWSTGSITLRDWEDDNEEGKLKLWSVRHFPERGLKGYYVKYVPSKFIEISHADTKRRVRIDDTFGFYQQSFIKALQAWKIDETTSLKRIEAGKHDRSTFARDDIPMMKAYCFDECQRLAQLTHKLERAIDSAGISINKYIGAGSIAEAFMRKHKVKSSHVYDRQFPEVVQQPILCAYFGGRMEMIRQGYFTPAHGYDIRSAYPTETLKLPPLVGGQWHQVRGKGIRHEVASTPFALWHVEWEIEPSELIAPFPFRERKGQIRYYCKGRGWYWTPEVRMALKHYGDRIKVLEGFVFEPKENYLRPFLFVSDIWNKRLQAKQAGLASEKVYKLGLNSLYGKTAQGGGVFHTRKPPFQSYMWAGLITAGTRARVLDIIYPHRDKVIGCATDGILFMEDPHLPTGTNLGDLEYTLHAELLYLMNGIYFGGSDHERTVKTRGHHARDIDYDTLLDGWRTSGVGFKHTYESTRFIGMGTALHRNDEALWRTWHTERRELRCLGLSKYAPFPPTMLTDRPTDYITLYPWADPWNGKTHSSAAYEAKHALRNQEQDQLVARNMLALEQPTLM